MDLTGVVPKRPPGRGRSPKYPWRIMEIGDTFICPRENAKYETHKQGLRYNALFESQKVANGILIRRLA